MPSTPDQEKKELRRQVRALLAQLDPQRLRRENERLIRAMREVL